MLQGWKAACAQACVSAFALGPVSTSEGSAGTGAAATPLLALQPQAIVILLVGVHFFWTQQSWHQGGSVAPVLHFSLGSNLCPCPWFCAGQSTTVFGLPWPSPGAPDGLFGISQDQQLWALWYRLGSRKKCEKTVDNHSDLPEGGNWKQIATKSHGHG